MIPRSESSKVSYDLILRNEKVIDSNGHLRNQVLRVKEAGASLINRV